MTKTTTNKPTTVGEAWAAPELLEALERAVKDLCNYCPADMTKKEKRSCRLCTRIDKWKKLIAKAKGSD